MATKVVSLLEMQQPTRWTLLPGDPVFVMMSRNLASSKLQRTMLPAWIEAIDGGQALVTYPYSSTNPSLSATWEWVLLADLTRDYGREPRAPRE